MKFSDILFMICFVLLLFVLVIYLILGLIIGSGYVITGCLILICILGFLLGLMIYELFKDRS